MCAAVARCYAKFTHLVSAGRRLRLKISLFRSDRAEAKHARVLHVDQAEAIVLPNLLTGLTIWTVIATALGLALGQIIHDAEVSEGMRRRTDRHRREAA